MLDKTFSVNGYVQRLFKEGHDDEQVITLLIRKADTESTLYNQLMRLGAQQLVRNYYAKGRDFANTSAEIEARREKEQRADLTIKERAVREQAKANRRRFWDIYTLSGHTLLRDAKIDDLVESIADRKKQVDGNQRAIRFESALLTRMKGQPNKTCAQIFTVAKMEDMRKRYYAKSE